MGTIKIWLVCSIIGLIGLSGCTYESLTYRTVTDGLNNKEYIVAGRVTDSGNRPIENCKVFLYKAGDLEPIPVGVTDVGGNYNLIFQRNGALGFWLHFDARDQGYPIRYENFSHLLESNLFQYTGNNPVIVNVVIDKTPLVQQHSNRPDWPEE
jgi:hypothetical protein